MAQPIVSITAIRMTDAWYQLSKPEQDALMAKVMAHRDQVSSVKSIVVCRAVGAPWDFIVVDEYPDIETAQKLDDLDAELNWKRYWEGMGLLGTRVELT
jgi:hypothetical protein